MNPFDFATLTKVVFGRGSIEKLGDQVNELGARRALIVTDPGIRDAGHLERVDAVLRRKGLITGLFDEVHENPTDLVVDRCVEAAREFKPELLIGLGGGSSMDTAKGANFILSNGGVIQDYWGVGKATMPMLPSIAVPTTAGTGSEAQSFALIVDSKSHRKMACGDKKVAFNIATLDPELSITQPEKVTAVSGIDAVSHAVETAVCNRSNYLSRVFSRESFRLLRHALPIALERPKDLTARGDMLLGAHLAGLAIENSMLGVAHSAANPLTAMFNVVHGEAVGVMLPHVVRFNAKVVGDVYQNVFGLDAESDPGELLATLMVDLLKKAGVATNLRRLAVDRSSIPKLAEAAVREWTAQFNPRAADQATFESLYLNAYQAA
jgi:alcohol dehydrogenase